MSRIHFPSAASSALSVLLMLSCAAGPAFGDTESLSPPASTLTRFGETKPSGWMLRQMQADLDTGLAGHYPEISDTVNMRRFELKNADQPDSSGNPGWWAGEHEGYYADGLFRLAWLAGDPSMKNAATARLQDVLSTQDASGYIGIYPADKRFDEPDGDDAELWTQSRMFQALLAWYEATGDTRILDAVGAAVKLTLGAYESQSYFERAFSSGGVSHGVAFSDTLEWLYRLTGDEVYRSGYLWLYADYATSDVRDDDMKPFYLADADRPWYSHTPHIAESLAMPAVAFAYGGAAAYAQAADEVLQKLQRYSNPGGGPVGDEAVDARPGSFDLTSEYCSMTESIASLNRLAQFRDAMATGDVSERIALNSAQGARTHGAATGVSYLTADNRMSATQTTALGDRLLYSASHLTAACCSLNSTRLLPYYVEGMWLKETGRAGLIARLYGPSTFDTTIGTTTVSIAEQTDFPFSDQILFTVSPSAASTFTLTLRIPPYSTDAHVIAPAGMSVTHAADRFEISGDWHAGDTVALDLAFTVRHVQDSRGAMSLAYGPLLYALPIDATATLGRITRASGSTSALVFQDVEYRAAGTDPTYVLSKNAVFSPAPLAGGDVLDPWTKPPAGLTGPLIAPDGSRVNVTLLPLGSTVLRTTGFVVDEVFSDSVGG